MRQLLILGTSLAIASLASADYQVLEIPSSSSGALNASGCCTMSHMGSSNPEIISMSTCQSVYMSCVSSRRAAVWQFDLSVIPADATLVTARFKGTRTESYMTGSGHLSMSFDTGPLDSSVCMSLWNGGAWNTTLNWAYGNDFNITVTSGINLQFGAASTVSILGYASSTSSVRVVNAGDERPVLELVLEVPDAFPCEGDLNDDHVVDGSDISLILGYWGQEDSEFDIDGNGLIDGADLAIVLGEWGYCPE